MPLQNGNWLAVAVVAFLGGIVSNLVRPERTGIIGFFVSGLIAAFCGFIAANTSQLEPDLQVGLAAVVGVMADRLLTFALIEFWNRKTTTVNNQYIGGEQNSGQQGTGNKQGQLNERE
jgi:uncharacterized membrane protein YeaQ/YmgE (transglycosylase-associated protein family)